MWTICNSVKIIKISYCIYSFCCHNGSTRNKSVQILIAVSLKSERRVKCETVPLLLRNTEPIVSKLSVTVPSTDLQHWKTFTNLSPFVVLAWPLPIVSQCCQCVCELSIDMPIQFPNNTMVLNVEPLHFKLLLLLCLFVL